MAVYDAITFTNLGSDDLYDNVNLADNGVVYGSATSAALFDSPSDAPPARGTPSPTKPIRCIYGHPYKQKPRRSTGGSSVGHDYASRHDLKVQHPGNRKASQVSIGHDYSTRDELGLASLGGEDKRDTVADIGGPASGPGFYSATHKPDSTRVPKEPRRGSDYRDQDFSGAQRGSQAPHLAPGARQPFYSVMRSRGNEPPPRNASGPAVPWESLQLSMLGQRQVSAEMDYKCAPYFHPNTSREQCETSLRAAKKLANAPDGLFLVRGTREPNMLCISVVYRDIDKVFHNRVQLMGQSTYKYLGNGAYFKSLGSVLRYHHAANPRMGNVSSTCTEKDGSIRLQAYIRY